MLVDAKSLALHALATKDEEAHRYTTHCVHVEPDGTAVATDGKAILAVEPAGLDDGEYPAVGDPAKVPARGVDVPADVVKEVLRSLPRQPQKPILGAALITKASEKRVELTTTDLKRTRRLEFTPDDSAFPDWRGMMVDPSEDEVGRVSLSLDELDRIVKTLKAVCERDVGTPHVTFHVRGDDKTVVLSGSAGAGRRFAGVLACVRVIHDGANDWQRRVTRGEPAAQKVRRIKGEAKP